MVKGYFLESAKIKEEAPKEDSRVWDTEDLWIFKSKWENLEGYSFYRFGLLKKALDTITSKTHFVNLTAVNQCITTIQLHIHLILNTMVRLTISCTIWLMAPKSYFKQPGENYLSFPQMDVHMLF
jgi:hypothetical protein